MTSQEFVHFRFPNAVAIHQDPVHISGIDTPIQKRGWLVLSVPSEGARLLGTGQTEAEAWDAAAKKMSAGQDHPRPNFKEWLAGQAESEASAEHRKRIIEEWKEAVAHLFSQMMRWLVEEDSRQVLTVETGMTRKEEEGLGAYDIAALRINLSTRFVELVPLGRNVVGGIGSRGDLGLRAEGRVDMRTRSRKYMLYRVADTEGKKWVIVDDDDYAMQNLTKEAFVTALQDLLS
jgi:hypothetical protein